MSGFLGFDASGDTKDPPGGVPDAEGPPHRVPLSCDGPGQNAGAADGPRHTGSRPGSPASVTKDAAVVTGAPGVVTAETVR
ncbi:hypothetical protein GCM10010372_08060 [Streptomyces tauricus]|nr:hypothetical protein GCM10010372_08060 [Streptomyces tauricus]